MEPKKLNHSQIEAIRHRAGPMMVLAGPGSGKTLVITYRTKYLIEHHGISPSDILVITFTRAAALQMQERFEEITGGNSLPVSFGTFHGVFFKILKYAYNYRAENILSEEQKYLFMKEILDRLDLEYEDENEFISALLGEISNVKGDLLPLEHYYAKNCSDSMFREIYGQYDEKLRRAGKVDFDDMLVMCYELFCKRKDILSAWQKKYPYILIDEFQDINKVQYEVIKLLAAPRNNLFIVGDDDQSVYRFRGARPEIMLHFEQDYKECKKVLLDVNYRSDGNIVEKALCLIGHNQNRFSKAIHAEKEKKYPVEYRLFPSCAQENAAVAEKILEYVKNGYRYSDIAILCRTKTGPRLLIQKMMEYNIPFQMKDALPNLYEHWIAKNIITYIKMALGSRKRRDFLQIMNKPNRYISRDSVTEEEVNLEELEKYYAQKEWMAERIFKLQYDLQMLKKMTPFGAIQYICQGIGYQSYLQEYAEYRKIKVQELYDVVEELKEACKPYRTYEEWFRHIEEYSEELKQQAKGKARHVQGVEFVTLHGAKGLEYEVVFLPDSNEGVIPHRKAMLPEDLEEERRMFYVGMTRAKQRLHIYSVQEQYGKQVQISRFVKEIGFGEEKGFRIET